MEIRGPTLIKRPGRDAESGTHLGGWSSGGRMTWTPAYRETTGVRRNVGRIPNPSSGPNALLGEPLKIYPASSVVRFTQHSNVILRSTGSVPQPGRDSFYQVSLERGTEPTSKFHRTYTPVPKNPTGNEHSKGQATRMSLVVTIDQNDEL